MELLTKISVVDPPKPEPVVELALPLSKLIALMSFLNVSGTLVQIADALSKGGTSPVVQYVSREDWKRAAEGGEEIRQFWWDLYDAPIIQDAYRAQKGV